MRNKNDLIIKLLIIHIKNNEKLYKSFNFSRKQQKYELSDYLIDILYVLKTGIAWRDLRSHINWNSVYKVFVKLNSYNIFKLSYIYLLKKYMRKGVNRKLKYIMTDTSFVPNKKGKELIGYNKFYNRKNGTKISLITDANGTSLNVKCYEGNRYDSKILIDHLQNGNLVHNNHILRYKQYFLADPGYDSKLIKETLIGMKYKPIIAQNKRNIKDPKKLVKLTKQEKQIYKKRLTIERTFNKIKMNRRICLRYESKIDNFMGFIYLSLIKLLC